MGQKRTIIILLILFFGAACFGGGVFYGQYALEKEGVDYTAANFGEGGPININTASVAALTKVEGIGEITAEKIVAEREENGAYDKVEELMTRGVIGSSKLSEIVSALTVE